MAMYHMLAVIFAAGLCASNAFVTPGGLPLRSSMHHNVLQRPHNSMRQAPKIASSPVMQMQELADGAMLLAAWPQPLVDGVTSYMNLYVPIFKSLNLPPLLLHWFHALNMGLVLTTMGGYGTYLGWKIRSEPKSSGVLAPGPAWANSQNVATLPDNNIAVGKSNADLHKTLMGGMAVIFFLGANGGLVLSLVQDKPIMQSPHFTTAMVGFALLAAQAALTTRFQGSTGATARTTHAFLGSATMAVFAYHAFLGLQLGLSL